jgi:hypothetical protein
MAYIGKGLDNGVRNQFIFAATQGQTAFSGADSDGKTLAISDILYTDCFQNGVKLEPTTDYTVTLTSLTLVNAASLNDVVDIVSFDIFAVPDTVPASTGGTFTGAISATSFSGSGASLTSLPAANLTGTVATARLGSGTAGTGNFLRGDGSWQTAGSTSASDLTSGTLPTARLPAGSVLQSKIGMYDGAASIALPSSFAATGYSMTGWAYTNVNVTLTPVRQGSMFFINSTVNFASTNHGERISFKLVREVGGTTYTTTGMPSIDGNRRMCHASTLYINQGSDEHMNEISMQTYDSPNTTSAVTYKLYVNQNSASVTFYINRPDNFGNASYIPKAISSVKAVEVAQ